MENTPKIQPGLTMKLFKQKADMALSDIISHFPSPRVISFPEYLKFYVASFMSETTQTKYNASLVPMNKVNQVDGTGSIFIITTADPPSIQETLKTFTRVKNFEKVVLVIPRSTESIHLTLIQEKYQVCTSPVTEKKSSDPSLIYLYDFPADFLPTGDDFFLLPSINSFYKINILSDFEDIYNSARALFRIESVFGNIPHIMSIGTNAVRVQQVLNQLNSTTTKAQMEISQIDSLIIIDRCVDLITPLTTELSIEGIINAAYNIQYSKVTPNIEKINSPVILSEFNEVFRTTRMMSWSRMINYKNLLQEKIEEKKRELEQNSGLFNRQGIFHEKYNEAMYLVDVLKKKSVDLYIIANESLRKLKKETPAFEEIFTKEFQVIESKKSAFDLAENLVLLYNDWANALRLICLESICGWKKISSNDVEKIQNEIINEFGIAKSREGILNLDKARFISTSERNITLASCLYKLGIWGPVDEQKNPTDACGTALGGYVPPSVRFVQKLTDGEIDQLVQDFSDKILINEFGKKTEREPGDPRRIIVFFVGGITLTEAGTIRNMGRSLYNGEVEFIVGGTDKISYNTFLQQLCPFLKE